MKTKSYSKTPSGMGLEKEEVKSFFSEKKLGENINPFSKELQEKVKQDFLRLMEPKQNDNSKVDNGNSSKFNLPKTRRMGSSRKVKVEFEFETLIVGPNSFRYPSYEQMKELSDGNLERFNQNFNYELVEQEGSNLKEGNFTFMKLMDHYHFCGEPIEKHYRCMVKHPKFVGYGLQDLSIEQWNSLPNSPKLDKNEDHGKE